MVDMSKLSLNENGHYVLIITGSDFTGEQESARMKEGGFRMGDYANQALVSAKADSYDASHCLENGKEYHIVLIPAREIAENPLTENIKEYAQGFGYEVPLAGIMPRIREVISDKQMEKMDVGYITGLHAPIKDAGGRPGTICIFHSEYDCCIGLCWVHLDQQWPKNAAFAFIDPN